MIRTRAKRGKLAGAAAVVAAAILWTGVASAAGGSGDLDTSFGGGDGIAVSSIAGFNVRGIAADSSGRTVAVGWSSNGTYNVWCIARFASDGSLDTSFFGGAGYKTFFGTLASNQARGVAIDGSGRIVVSGQVTWLVSGGKRPKTQTGFGVMRLLSDGTTDTSFGAAGTVLTGFSTGGVNPMAATVQVQPDDGKILAAGYSGSYVALARYTDSGAPDSTFGAGTGSVTLSLGTSEAYLNALRRDAVGRYVFVTPGRPTAIPSMLARVLPGGALDTTFGVRNLTTALASFGTRYRSSALELTSDDKILVAGSLQAGTDGFSTESVVSRFDASGALDTTFGSSGIASPHLPLVDEARGLGIQVDGRIVLVSSWGNPALPSNRGVFAASRYLADGTPDTTYGTGGLGQIADSGTSSSPWAGVLDPSGNWVAAGNASGSLPMLARWLP